MKELISILVGIILIYFTFQLVSCQDDEGVNNPEEQTSNISGVIDLPIESTEDLSLSINLGEQEIIPNSDGNFSMECNNEVPGMLIINNNDNPVLLGLVPNPETASEIKVDIHSTALSLVFINPFICTSNPAKASEIAQTLESFQELNDLENILKQRLASDINAISTLDDVTENAIKAVVVKYINSLTADTNSVIQKLNKIKEDVITISPLNIVSGHQIKHLGDDNFSISNWYGRWAKCITPNDTMYLQPNNDMISIRPWAESTSEFTLEIIPNEPPKEILVYGFGLNNKPEENWSTLTDFEKEQIEFTGKMTVLIEFLPHVLSLVTNFPFEFSSKKEAVEFVGNIVRWQIQYAKNFEKAKLLLADGRYWDYYWMLVKEYVALLATDDNFREFFLTGAKITISNAMFEKLAKVILLPANVIYIADDLTGIMKTILGLTNAKYKARFEIFSENITFGNVTGNVYDKESGSPIQGVKIELSGDDNNPFNPSHTYTTDAGGGFWFENIQAGEITLTASKEEYGSKSVTVQVEEEKTSEVTITLSKDKGTLQGKIINEVFLKNGITPANFNKDCHLSVNEIGGNNYSSSFWIWASKNGEFQLELTPGRYEIKAWHNDYLEEVDTITIAGDEIKIIDDIVLKPNCSMTGTINYDMDFDGSYEYQFNFNPDTVGAAGSIEQGDCLNGSDRTGIVVVGMNLTETFSLVIDTFQVTQPDYFSIGDIVRCGCPGENGKSTAFLISNRFKCTHPEYGYSENLVFGMTDLVDDIPCNCGIDNPGTLYITEYSTKLGDAIHGNFVVDLAGWKGCHCGCCDEDGNYFVDCATVKIDIYFKVIVGSLYDEILNKNSLLKMHQ